VRDEDRYNWTCLQDLLAFLGRASRVQALEAYQSLEKGGSRAQYGDTWLICELGRQDLFYLLYAFLNRRDINNNWLYARCREIEASPDGNLDLWAREHYKSTIITFALTIQDVLRDPNVTVGIFSHTRPIAKSFLKQIKSELETNERLKTYYKDVLWADPKKESPKWSEDEGITVRRSSNPKEATIEAWGLVDGMPIGKHFKLLIYDDVVTRESVNTPDMMKKTTEALELSYSLGSEDGTRRFIGTRYHFNDAYRTIIDRGTAKPRVYPATTNGEATGEPVLLTRESLAQKRRDMGVYIFGCQMLLNPKADSTQGFKEEWLDRWTPDDGAGLNVYILVDPASSKKESADYTVHWVIGLGPDENYYVLGVYRDRLNLTERTTRLFDLVKRWKPIEVRYEEYGLQADVEHIEEEQVRRKYRFKITKVGGQTRKEDRIKRLIPLFENHRIILPKTFTVVTIEGESKDLIHEFIETEYKAFPVPVHDDMLDALARIAEPDLPLKWPSAKRKFKTIPVDLPLDPDMGM
jgi:predicted phage terminase large subunit-like protein